MRNKKKKNIYKIGVKLSFFLRMLKREEIFQPVCQTIKLWSTFSLYIFM
jgi:hypothetical protein